LQKIKPSYILLTLLIITAAVCVGAFGFIQQHSIVALQEYALKLTGNVALKHIIEKSVTTQNISVSKTCLILAAIMSLNFVLVIMRYKHVVDNIIIKEYSAFKKAIRRLFAKQNFTWAIIVPLIFLIAHSAYYIYYWAMQHDECWTYTHFINKSLVFNLLAPYNNHNLFTTLAWPLCKLPFDTKIILRCVALIPAVLSLLVWHRVLIKIYTNKHSLLLGNTLYVCLMPVLYYAVCARGYSLVLLCTVLLIHRLQLLITFQNSKRHYIISGIIIALGLYSNLCFAYQIPALCMLAIWGIYSKKISLKYCFVGLGICMFICCILLGVPLIILGNLTQLGTEAQFGLVQNALLQFDKISYFFTSYNQSYWWYVVTIIGCILALKQHKFFTILILAQLLFALLLIVLQSRALYERSFVYLSPYFALAILFLVLKLNLNKSLKSTVIASFFALAIYIFAHHPLFIWCDKLDKDVQATAHYAIKNNFIKVYMPHNYCKPAFEYYYTKANHELQIGMANAQSINFASLDSTYDAIISKVDDTITYPNFKLSKQFGDEVKLWTKK
jgi:hypothetical protein